MVEAVIVPIVLKHCPEAQAIYLYGSRSRAQSRSDSDIDIAVLLPPGRSGHEKCLCLSRCQADLESALASDVDLVDARHVSTVFQKEIISGKRVYCGDVFATDEFEMLVISFYQKLNEERRQILEAFFATGRAYAV